MINAIHQNVNNSSPSFEGAKLNFERGFAKQFKEYVDNSGNLNLIEPDLIGRNGKLNVKKVMNILKEEFKDSAILDGQYSIDSFNSKKSASAVLRHYADDGSEIVEEQFKFNPTQLLTKRITNFLKDMIEYPRFNNFKNEANKSDQKAFKKIKNEIEKRQSIDFLV